MLGLDRSCAHRKFRRESGAADALPYSRLATARVQSSRTIGLMSEAAHRKMYAPGAYAASDPAAIVAKYPFAHLITSVNGESFATPTPILFETDDTRATLIGHIAVHLTRTGPDRFELMVLRGFAESLWHDLETMSAEFR